jgi:hypothetical protein
LINGFKQNIPMRQKIKKLLEASAHYMSCKEAFEAAQKNAKAPSFEDVCKSIRSHYHIGDDDDLEDCSQCQKTFYKEMVKLMELEEK